MIILHVDCLGNWLPDAPEMPTYETDYRDPLAWLSSPHFEYYHLEYREADMCWVRECMGAAFETLQAACAIYTAHPHFGGGCLVTNLETGWEWRFFGD
jgi:hypothetical protein